MIGRSVQRAALKVSCRHLPQLGPGRDVAAAAVSLLPENCSNCQCDSQHHIVKCQVRFVTSRSLGNRCFSSDGTSSESKQEGSEETSGDASSIGEALSNEERDSQSSAEEGSGGGPAAEAGSEGSSEDAAETSARQNVYRPPPDVPIPDASMAAQVIDHYRDDAARHAFKVNHAGEHSSGWQLYDVDEENTIVWWMLDLTGGRVPENEKNAQLSDHVKHFMYRLNKEGGWSVPQIAELFRVRQQRVMAIIALKEMEISKREAGEELFEDLHEDMEHVYECYEERGTFERHVVLLPTKPAFEVIGTGGGRRTKKGKKGAGKPEQVYEGHEDPGWESEVRTREDEVAAHEERIMVKEFRERLAFNLGKVGQSISKESLAKQAPKRPAEGWSIVVRPAGRGVEFEPFVARPDGSRRPLTSDEELYIDRMKPLPRRRFV